MSEQLQSTKVESVPRQIFRAYDIRGKVAQLSDGLVAEIGKALATQFIRANQQQVVIGYDARLSSYEFSEIITEQLTASGLDVYQIGCVSSPLLYFTAKRFGGNGVMITASHNPATDNGFKWLCKNLPPTAEQIQHVADLIESQDFQTLHRCGKVITIDAKADYFSYLKQDIKLQNNHRICVDGLHGSAGEIAQTALENLSCEVTALNCYADGNFPDGAPDPSDFKRLETLQKAVLDSKSVMGIALDGDGDRVVVIDELGQWISPDRLMCAFAKICLTDQKVQPSAEIVFDVKCSTMIAQTVARYHGRSHMLRTGSSFLRHYIAAQSAVFGGEYAGHYVFNDGRGLGYDDGLYAALRLLEYLESTQQSLSTLLAEFPERTSSPDIYIDANGIDREQLFAHIQDYIHNNLSRVDAESMTLSCVDGIRLDFPYGFGIIRASNTGEYFTVRFDADDALHLAKIKAFFVEMVHTISPHFAQALQEIAA
ncbi:phosphomannomutase / phosphoglucomutase [Acinetobacter marinus]|uniref:phosphomannomutase n=1 Tax=Acinetobacter marinus TaxID=281375 RepID=A0A1G6J323_9GAMM|nr:phosphomannomutase/phosphoglucomutase [Acinetobacter marinus]SDC13244.1 phosphomannomutase / phosphoglucomutase [Acinetobacter marinus]